MKRPKHRAVVIRECQTKTVRVHRVQKGDDMFREAGQWMLRTLAELSEKCVSIKRKPCIHLDAVKLSSRQIEKLNRSDWYNELEELMLDVQRGKRGSS